MNIKTRGLTTTKAMRGYTIVEVMIFVVVSGGLLVSVLGLISGQQQKTRFKTGVYDFESTIQDLVNDVETGYYPNSGTPGTDNEHIYLGKAVQFYEDSSTREVTKFREVTIQASAMTNVIPYREVTRLDDPGASVAAVPSTLLDRPTYNGVEITKIRYLGGGGSESHGFAIISGINSEGGRKSTGSRGQVAKLDVGSTTSDSAFMSAVGGLGLPGAGQNAINSAKNGAIFCLREAGGGRPAAVRLEAGVTTTYFDQEAEDLECER